MQRRAAAKLLDIVGSRNGGLLSAQMEGGAAVLGGQCSAPTQHRSAGVLGAAVAYYSHPQSAAAASAAAMAPFRLYSSAASPTAKSTQNVPLGHHDSDLTSVACHIGLGRRRDLTMRDDLGLWKNGDTRVKLSDVFKVRARVCTDGWDVVGRWVCVLSCVGVDRRQMVVGVLVDGLRCDDPALPLTSRCISK